MNKAKKIIAISFMIGMISTVLAGCSSSNNSNVSDSAKGTASSVATASAASSSSSSGGNDGDTAHGSTRAYTDYKGHKVDIPAESKRIVFAGETTGDLLVLGLPLVGINGDELEGRVYEKEAAAFANVGFPINLEKVTSLNPDIIIVADTDEQAYAKLSKIAPTLMLDTFATLDERMTELGTIFNKKQEAADWLAAYNAKAELMWKNLYATVLKPGETASVFTYYPGDRLFVMARAGLSQLLYGKNGLKPTAPIQDVLKANEGFRQFSAESIADFAGDRIFILDPVADEAKKSTESLLNNPVWKALPAVKEGQVYHLYIQSSDSDAFTRLWLLDELPKMLNKQ